MMLQRKNVVPIQIREDEKSDLFALLMTPLKLNWVIEKSTEFALSVMLEHKLILIEDRKAVWLYHLLKGGIRLYRSVGESFPDNEFAKNCCKFCKEKVERAIKTGLLCSHQNRNPEHNEWGGSAYLKFELISIDGSSTIVEVDLAPSGLKEWEDLALGLTAYYHAGFIKFEDLQVQNILQEADNSVAGQTDFLPKDMTIKQYVNKVFEAID